MHADTPPATPTPEGLAAALRLIDYFVAIPYAPEMTALIAFARAQMAIMECNERYVARSKAGMSIDERNALDAECEAAEPVLDAAVADLVRVALATGAKAGEGAGGS